MSKYDIFSKDCGGWETPQKIYPAPAAPCVCINIQGAQGEKGEPGVCECAYAGQLILNGGMEEFTDNAPNHWNVNGKTSRISDPKRVHTGEYSVNLSDHTTIWQEVENIREGCFYELSFYAHAEGVNDNAVLRAEVVFITQNGEVSGAAINCKDGSIPYKNERFGYYRTLTSAAPEGTLKARISIRISIFAGSPELNPSLDIDEVSFAVR